jgi:hypothetical protein
VTVTDYDRRKAARVASRRATEEHLTHKQIRKFDKTVRDLVLYLVNVVGVDYRLYPDGQHIRLYWVDPSVPPSKVSSSQRPVVMCKSLRRWAAQNNIEIDI